MTGRVPIPDRDARRPRTHKLSTFRGRPMPNLSANEEICPVCDQPGTKLPADDKPGQRYRHDDRMVVCRYVPGLEGLK